LGADWGHLWNLLFAAGVSLAVHDFRPRKNRMHEEDGRKVESPVEARAGFRDRPVLIVLCASLVLGVIILGALWLDFFTPVGPH
jgi:hypothetical protein